MTLAKSNQLRTALCRGIITAAAVATVLTLRAQQSDADKPKPDAPSSYHTGQAGDAATCITEAAKMNMATIKFGQMASQKAVNPELKRFAQMIEADHTKAQAKLRPIAVKHHITLPTSLDAKCEEEMAKLQALSGAEFDKEFAKGAVEGHAMALAHLQQASSKTTDPDLTQYTKDMLTRVKEHQQRGREIAKAVGLDQATIAALENKAKEGVGTPGSSTETSRGTSSKDSDKPVPQTAPREP